MLLTSGDLKGHLRLFVLVHRLFDPAVVSIVAEKHLTAILPDLGCELPFPKLTDDKRHCVFFSLRKEVGQNSDSEVERDLKFCQGAGQSPPLRDERIGWLEKLVHDVLLLLRLLRLVPREHGDGVRVVEPLHAGHLVLDQRGDCPLLLLVQEGEGDDGVVDDRLNKNL